MKEDGPGFCGWCGGPNEDCRCSPDCEHDSAIPDLLDGSATCQRCGGRWYPLREVLKEMLG